MMNTYLRKHLIILPLLLILAACDSSDEDDLTRYIKDVKLRKATPIEPIPEFAPLETFVYPDSPGRRNPFKAKNRDNGANRYAPNTNRPRQPLERFPLDALKFVGVWKEGGMIWGLVSQPGGVITRVRTGDYMGQNFGRIIKISETSLKLEERVQVSGKWDVKVTTFNLNPNE